jgi:hypothetical protein
MKLTAGIVAALVLVLLIGCRSAKREEEKSSVPQMSRAEIFNLQTECAKLTQKMYDDRHAELDLVLNVKSYAYFHGLEQNSNYDPVSNRCYAELTTHTTDRAGTGYSEYSRELYDAQTQEMLANAVVQDSAGNLRAAPNHGMVFAYTSKPYDNSYKGADAFITERMQKLY